MDYGMNYGQPSIFATLAQGIFIAALVYGAFPAIFVLSKPRIKARSYRWICLVVNLIVFFCFSMISGNYNAAPYLLWTLIFSSIFKGFLPKTEPPIDYSKMEKKSFEEISSSVPEEVLAQCGSQRGNREGITRVAEAFAKDGVIPLEYVPVLVEEFMKPAEQKQIAEDHSEEPQEELPAEQEPGICYCRFCGAKIAEEDKFCRSCGAELNSAIVHESKPEKTVTEKSVDYRAFIAIGAIVLLVLVAVIVVIGMVGNSSEPVSTPEPTEAPTPIPTPDEPKNTTILFPSPEQNGVEWPENMSWTYTPWSGDSGGVESWPQYYSAKAAIEQSIQDSGLGNGKMDSYVTAYMEARANGENDLEAHITALTTTDVDKYLLGKREYTEYIYNSASEVGVSESDTKQVSDKTKFTLDDSISITWNFTWNNYTHSRDNRGKNHEQAIETVEWSLFSNENSVEWMEGARKEKYLECGLSKTEVSAKIEKEREELFRLLKEYYEGPGLDVEDMESIPTYQAGFPPAAAPYNGQILITPSYECLCPFEVSVQDDTAYYVYLKHMYAPTTSADKRQFSDDTIQQFEVAGAAAHKMTIEEYRKSNYYASERDLFALSNTDIEGDIAFYIAPNSAVEINVPVGVYKLYYACGKSWYGLDQLFGEETLYSTSDELLEFYTDYSTAYGHSLELWSQYDGNFETENIDATQFPG